MSAAGKCVTARSAAGSRPPGAVLLHPLSLSALVVLVMNDHVLKRYCPSALTGKLSDFAGVLLLPLALHALAELALVRLARRPLTPAQANRLLAVCVVVAGLAFALPELWLPAEHAYRLGLGALQWPAHAVVALFEGQTLPWLRPVRATADAGDLVALPMLLVALRLAWQRSVTPKQRPQTSVRSDRVRRFSVVAGAFCCNVLPCAARAQSNPAGQIDTVEEPPARRGARTHDGFYLDVELGGGAIFVDSKASISNGFQQGIPATARGIASPWLSLALGGTLRPIALVLGGRYTRARANQPIVKTLGETFEVRELALELTELSLFARYYPDPQGGLALGAALGLLELGVAERGPFDPDPSIAGESQAGASVSVEGSYTFWLSRQLSAGGSARLTAAALDGQQGNTLLLAPALLAGIIWH